jgi:hypothetical protein
MSWTGYDENYEKEYKIKEKLLKHLQEFYIKYDFDWVDQFVDDMYRNTKSTDEIKKEYNIDWKFVEDSRDNLIVKTSYNGKYNIWFNLNIIKDEDRYKDELKIELKRAIAHEDIHRQQFQDGFDSNKVPGPNDGSYKYISSPQEISARGIELAHYFEEKKYDVNRAIESIEEEKNLGPFEEIVSMYKEIGGSVYHKYLSEVYRRLVGED